jgi:hypothetical protein
MATDQSPRQFWLQKFNRQFVSTFVARGLMARLAIKKIKCT